MNALLGIGDYPLAHRVGWVLLHSLWQGALVGAGFSLLSQALRRRRAEARYVVGCLALALLLAGPIVTLSAWPVHAAARGSVSGGAALPSTLLPVLNLPGGAGSPTGNGSYSLIQLGTDFCGRLAPMVTAAWLLGVAVCLLRLTRGCWWVRRIRTRHTEPAAPAWLELLDDLRRRLGISRPVCLLKSALVEVPTIIGWIRPVILLPAASLAGLAPEQLEAILAHELAHVRRFDYLVNACQCLVETLMFYHPVVWWVSRCVREERENCCDDMVVRTCGNRLAYARALAALEESRPGLAALAFAASGAPLLNRIRRLLGAAGDGGPATARQLGGLALLGLGLALVVLGVYLMFAATSYQAVARIKVERDRPDIPHLLQAQLPLGNYDPYFIQTEFEVIQSELILGKVIESLHLQEEWGKKYANGEKLTKLEAIGLLKGRMALHPVRNTILIEIRVFSDKPKEAADLANAIAEAYEQYRLEERANLSEGGIKALLEARNLKETEIAEAQANLDRLRRQLNISDSMASEYDAAPLLSAETLRHLNGLRLDTEAEFVRQDRLLSHLKSLDREQLIQALPTAAADNLLGSLLEQKTVADQRLLTVQKDYGPNHPDVVRAKDLAADLQDKINKRVDGILAGLAAKVDSVGHGLTNLMSKVEEAAKDDRDMAAKRQPYLDAKRRVDELQRFRTLLDTKIASEKVDVSLPKTVMVTITDRAVPPEHPASPHRFLALMLIGSGLLFNLVGILMVRAERRTAA